MATTKSVNSTENPALLAFHHVSVMLGDKRVLHDITLTIGAGEHVAILGPNGCGKPTLIKTVTRECYPLVEPGASLKLLGNERWNIFELRSAMGIVTNDLMAECARPVTGEELVVSGFFSSIGIWPHQRVTEAMRERARGILDQIGRAH